MIYLDELLPNHRKILLAGRLIGEKAGGRCAALGLFVAAIGYARQHLTDGVVPDEFLIEVARSRSAIQALCRAKLIKKVRGEQWRIHDFLVWNKTADQMMKERGLSKTRQQRWRQKQKGETGERNAVTPPSTERYVTSPSRVPTIPVPRTPYPEEQDPSSVHPISEVQPPSPDRCVPKEELPPLRVGQLYHDDKKHDEDQDGCVVSTALRDRTRPTAARAHDRLRRVEGAHQGSDGRDRLPHAVDGGGVPRDERDRARASDAAPGSGDRATHAGAHGTAGSNEAAVAARTVLADLQRNVDVSVVDIRERLAVVKSRIGIRGN